MKCVRDGHVFVHGRHEDMRGVRQFVQKLRTMESTSGHQPVDLPGNIGRS